MINEDDVFTINSADTSEGSWLAKAGWLFLRLALFLLSAATTAGFFYVYAGGTFVWVTGEQPGDAIVAPMIAALAGVILLDGGLLVWGYIRAYHASTIPQMALAGAMGVIDLTLSILVTGIFVVLTSGLDSGLDAAGIRMINQLGLAVLVLAISGNFGASYAYGQIGQATKEAAQARRLAATVQAGKFAADDATAHMLTARTLAAIKAELPARTDQEAETRRGRYMADLFTESGAVSPAASGNGNFAGRVNDMSQSSRQAQNSKGMVLTEGQVEALREQFRLEFAAATPNPNGEGGADPLPGSGPDASSATG